MNNTLEPDGLLSVRNPPSGSTSYQADHFARLHPATTTDVRDFHALTDQYHEKLIADQFPEVAEARRLERQRRERWAATDKESTDPRARRLVRNEEIRQSAIEHARLRNERKPRRPMRTVVMTPFGSEQDERDAPEPVI